MVDNPFNSLPRDPNTGVPIISIGSNPMSNVSSQGQDQNVQAPISNTPQGQDQGAPPTSTPQDQSQAPVQVAQGPAPETFTDDELKELGNNVKASQSSASVQNQPSNEPSAQPQQQSSATGDDVDPDDIQKAAVRSSMVNNKTMGSVMDIARSFNEDTLRLMQPIVSGAMAGGAQEGASMMAQGGRPDLAKSLEELGEQYINDPNKAIVPMGELFDKLGIEHGYADTYMSDAGKQVWNTIATSLALSYGAASMATKMTANGVGKYGAATASVANRAISLAVRKYSQGVAQSPEMYLAGELLGGLGATVGGEKMQDYASSSGRGNLGMANLLGSLAGGSIGGGSAWLTMKAADTTMRISKLAARGIAEAVSEVSHMFGGPEIGAIKSIGRPGAPIHVNQEHLDAARSAESQARDAGDAVIQARQQYDKTNPWTAQQIEARLALTQALSNEKDATKLADAAWDKIPDAVRGKYSRQQQAIRSKFADTEYPKQFAAQQVEGEKASIQHQVTDVFKEIAPEGKGLTSADASAKLSDTLWKVRRYAKGMLNKYWNRSPLNKKMPDRSVLKSLDGFTDSLTKKGFNEKQVPGDEFDRLRNAFGDIQKPAPTLGWMKNFMTGLHEEANKAYLRGDNILGSNYDRFHSMLYGVVSKAFPDNVPLQQARDASSTYFDIFTRSELGPMFKGTRAGGDAVHPEDVMTKLLNRARGFRDLRTAVSWLDKQGITNIKDPAFVSKAEKETLDSAISDAQEGVKAHVQDYIQQNEGDPAKVAKLLGDPSFQKRIQVLGKVAGEFADASDQLKDLVDRKLAVEKSALAKYAERDSDKALDMVWSSPNPSKMANSLMDGTAGVGGFKDDPIAMQGFKAGLLDRFYSLSRGDPARMRDILKEERGRLLKTVLSSNEYNRLDDLITRIETYQAEYTKKEEGNKVKTFFAQYLALKFAHYLPHVGEGGELKKASLISGLAKDTVESMMHAVPPEKMFHEAIENPAFEAALYSATPTNRAETKELTKTMRRAIVGERSILGYFNNWTSYGDGPQANPDADTSSIPLPNAQGITP